jgi:cytochrome b subunit of formate dehydrogenase
MDFIEFDPANPQEFENFVCVDERRQNQKVMIVFVSLLVITIGIGGWILYQQKKEFQKKRNSFVRK